MRQAITNLPSITQKQLEILRLLYRYRFLNRIQIQQLLGHKDKRRIISWLKELREKQYVDWQYDRTDFIAKSQPAIYRLGLNAIRLLRAQDYSDEELRKRYKESERSQTFIERCLLIANCCITLKESGQYSWVLPADYAEPAHQHHTLVSLKPQLFFIRHQDGVATSYLFESFEQSLPRYQLRKRLKDIVDFLAYEWDEEEDGPVPRALFVCANKTDLMYVKRRTKQLLEVATDDNLVFRITIIDQITSSGVTGTIWEDI